ncbi:MAG TPA: sigma factor-like helix-turn-helix DNA-binding protein [Kineosporiaceae bacterium]|nr:sigma factor-like helix-turn-helix DNA-binding protein [Kineosporiaceae bacterium]
MEELIYGYRDADCPQPVDSPDSAWCDRYSPKSTPRAGPIVTLDLTEDVIAIRPGGDARSVSPSGRSVPAATPAPPRIKFTTFVLGPAERLLGTAFLLTGDWERAEALLRNALADAGVSWAHRHREPEAEVLRALVRRSTGPLWWWERPIDAAPLPGAVGAGLALLGSRQRVAVVLRYHQRLTEEETAAALGAPAGNVRSWISRGLDRLGIDTRLDLRPEAGPGLSRGGLSQELAALAAAPHQAVAAEARLADVRDRLPGLRRHEHRRRVAAGTGAVATSVALIIMIVLIA